MLPMANTVQRESQWHLCFDLTTGVPGGPGGSGPRAHFLFTVAIPLWPSLDSACLTVNAKDGGLLAAHCASHQAGPLFAGCKITWTRLLLSSCRAGKIHWQEPRQKA